MAMIGNFRGPAGCEFAVWLHSHPSAAYLHIHQNQIETLQLQTLNSLQTIGGNRKVNSRNAGYSNSIATLLINVVILGQKNP